MIGHTHILYFHVFKLIICLAVEHNPGISMYICLLRMLVLVYELGWFVMMTVKHVHMVSVVHTKTKNSTSII